MDWSWDSTPQGARNTQPTNGQDDFDFDPRAGPNQPQQNTAGFSPNNLLMAMGGISPATKMTVPQQNQSSNDSWAAFGGSSFASTGNNAPSANIGNGPSIALPPKPKTYDLDSMRAALSFATEEPKQSPIPSVSPRITTQTTSPSEMFFSATIAPTQTSPTTVKYPPTTPMNNYDADTVSADPFGFNSAGGATLASFQSSNTRTSLPSKPNLPPQQPIQMQAPSLQHKSSLFESPTGGQPPSNNISNGGQISNNPNASGGQTNDLLGAFFQNEDQQKEPSPLQRKNSVSSQMEPPVVQRRPSQSTKEPAPPKEGLSIPKVSMPSMGVPSLFGGLFKKEDTQVFSRVPEDSMFGDNNASTNSSFTFPVGDVATIENASPRSDGGALKVRCRVCNQMIEAVELDRHSASCSVLDKEKQNNPNLTPRILVAVLEPRKEGTTLSNWTVYKVGTKFTFPTGPMGEIVHVVHRRDTDFEWFAQFLAIEFPENVIPPLPDKGSKISEQTKQRDYARFLEAVLNNAQINGSKIVKAFIEVPEEKSQKFRPWQKSVKLENPLMTSVSDKVLSLISKESSQSKDPRVEKAREFLQNLLGCLTAIVAAVEKLHKQEAELANTYLAFGDALFSFIKDPKNHATIEGPMGQCVKSIGREMTDQIGSAEQLLAERLKFWLRYTKECQALLTRYDTAEQNHNAFLASYQKKKAEYEGMTDIAKQNSYKPKVDEAYKSWKSSEKTRGKIYNNMFNEFNRFNSDKTAALKDIFINYSKSQHVYFAKIASTWNVVEKTTQ